MVRPRTLLAVVALAAAFALPAMLRAQPTPPQARPEAKPEMMENCPGLVASAVPRGRSPGLPPTMTAASTAALNRGDGGFMAEVPD